MEPLLIKTRPELVELSSEVVRLSLELKGKLHATSCASLRALLRSMNSFYSNRIEGQNTHPRSIERALRRDFSSKPDIARLQRIAVAHLEAEQELEASPEPRLTKAFAQRAHAALYQRLSKKDRGDLEPGALRKVDVEIGAHTPPRFETLDAFLDRYESVYASASGWDSLLFTIACAHHRLVWIHPFADGNGRAARLVTHAALSSLSGGLWSASRGLARQRSEYYAALAGADSKRRDDYDGRGNLSESGLAAWCRFFIELCDDQVRFMSSLLDLDGMRRRYEALVAFSQTGPRPLRPEVAIALHHVFTAGPVTRGEFKQLTGLQDRTAQSQVTRLLEEGLLASDTPKGPVRIDFPLDALSFLLPDLYPEAATRE